MIAAVGLRARAEVRVERGPDGRCSLTRLRSSPPLALRATPGRLYLVGSAAGPLGGDDTHLSVFVGPGAELDVRSAAASVVLTGRSATTVDADVDVGGHLHYAPEPVVVTAGAAHRSEATVLLAPGARLAWWETLVLGRHGEAGGAVRSRVRIAGARGVLVDHGLDLAAGWSSPAVVGDAKVVCTGVLLAATDTIAPGGETAVRRGSAAGVRSGVRGGTVVQVVGPDVPAVADLAAELAGPGVATMVRPTPPEGRNP